MLLDADSPAAHLPPAPIADRPARSEIAPQRRDDSPPAVDRRADASPPSAPQDDAPNATGASHAANSSKSDIADASDDTGDTNDNDGLVSAGDGAADQAIADSLAANAQIASAQIVIGPAIAPITLASDAAPAQPVASPNDATVAAIATALASPPPDTATSATPPTEQRVTAQSTSDVPSAAAGNPGESAENLEPNGTPSRAPTRASSRASSYVPAALAELAKAAASATPAASTETTAAGEPAAATAPTKPTSDTAPAIPATAATPATAAEPAKKIVPAGRIESAARAEPAVPVNDATPAARVDDATPVAPAVSATPAAPKKPEQDAAPIAAANTPAPVKLQSEHGPTQIDSPSTNANPLALAAHAETAKNRGTQPEVANDHDHHLSAEQVSSAKTIADSANRLVEPALARSDAETTQLPTPSIPLAQVVNSAMPANAATSPIAAATAAIPLAGLPIEIATQAKDGKNRFEIRLDPPELGRIDVRLDIDNKGIVTSRLVAERPETLDLLRRDAPQIERALQDAGLKTSDQGLQFSLRDQSFAQQNDDSLPVAANLVLPPDDIVPLEAMRQGYGRMIGLGGGIDIRV
jgi:flagellar hook-length control protein FliK